MRTEGYASMTAPAYLELAAAIAMIGAGVWLYRRRSAGERRGSQGAVFLLLVGAIVAMHALGAFEYRPSQAEIDRQALPPAPERGR